MTENPRVGMAPPDEWCGVDVVGQRLRRRAVTAVELVQAVLARVEELGPVLNAFITVTATDALEAAARADDELARGEDRGPLHGLPVGIKDAIDVAGVRCTFGSRILRDRHASADAGVVRALRSAGAVIAGKQNLHEFAYGITGENPHFGDTANPWDPARVTGGSSGGTAAAIAGGLVALGVGTDTGGSVRIPAAMCGVVGLKPTYGTVSREGVLPLAWSLDHVGPLARSVLDCFRLLDVITGGRDRTGMVRGAAGAGLEGTRVGVPVHHFFDGIEPAVEETVRAAVDVLVGCGARLVEVALPHAIHAQAAASAVMGAEAASWHHGWLRERPDDYGADVRLRLRQGALTPAVDYLNGQKLRAVLQHEFLAAFESVDVIVSPTVPIVAPRRGHTLEPAGIPAVVPRSVINRLTVPANMTGFPVITVPCGRADGLPVGLQLMGPPNGEVGIGATALAYELATTWHHDRPPVAAP
jgi:aspartyl-tRNA(Asn)/glutamyl-tRNA(Gln) amidotransferase subunit A